jgi:tetratricopeptide (TPR) repeat protein
MFKQLPHGISSPLSRTAQVRRLLYRGEIARSQGDLCTAEYRGRSALTLLDDTANHRPSAITAGIELRVASLELVARVRRELTDFTRAGIIYRDALDVLDSAPKTAGSDRRLVPVLNGLGEALRLLGRFSEAEEHSRRAVQVAERIQPADPMLLATRSTV